MCVIEIIQKVQLQRDI